MGFSKAVIYCFLSLFLYSNLLHCTVQKFDFVPDVVHFIPNSVLSVKFGGKELRIGSELTPTQVKDTPSVSWLAKPNEYYTICMTDPDAPSRQDPKFREFLHWLVCNIPGNDISKGDTLAEYVGSGPPKNTGLHRYVLLLFKQQTVLNLNTELKRNNTSRMGRKNFSIQKFAEKYDLVQPALGGNYFLAKWDAYVPTVHKQLSGK